MNHSYKITFKEAERRLFAAHKDNIKLIEFHGGHGKSLFKCTKCGREWNADTWSVWKGNGCFQCSKDRLNKKFKHSFEYVKEYIEKNNCILLSDEYINERENIRIKFPCGHISNMCFGSFKRGSRCKICGTERFKYSRKYTQDKIDKIMNQNGLTFVSFPEGYKNRDSKIRFICSKNHINEILFSSFLRNPNCSTCTKNTWYEKYGRENSSNWKGGATELSGYVYNRNRKWIEESMKLGNYKCVISGERASDVHHIYSSNLIIEQALKELHLDFEKEIKNYTKKDLKNILDKYKEISSGYPAGVCLTKAWHIKFHQVYGYGDTTPEMWNEFLEKVKQKEIRI